MTQSTNAVKPETKTAIARLIPPSRPGGSYAWEVICCPYCGKKHRHGAGGAPEEVNSYLGHRTEHCVDLPPGQRGGYYLVA